MEQNYSLKSLLELFLSKIWLIVVLTLCGGIAAFCVSKFAMPLQYSSHISMYVQSYTSSSSEDESQGYNNISNSKQLINTYIEVLKDDAVMNAVADGLTEKFDEGVLKQNFSMSEGAIAPSSLRACISITSVSDTSALTVTATTHHAELSAAICNHLARVSPQYLRMAVGVGSINVIDTAKVYNTPVAPNIRKNTMMGLAAGLVLSLLIIVMIDFFDNTVKKTDALTKLYNKGVIGEIQHIDTDKKKKPSDSDVYIKVTDEKLPFSIVESYKSIRTNITFSLSTFDKKIFAVSSPNPGEGKSTISANLAQTLAQGESKILLIDADMRKPQQHKIFGLQNKKGLSSAVSKMNPVEECIQKNVVDHLDVMTAGPIPPNPSELLASEQMGKILSQLVEQYDIILIDTPPVNPVTDAMELTKHIAGMIMVLRYGKTKLEEVEFAMKKIELSQMNLLGFVLNDVKSKHLSNYYSKYQCDKNYKYNGIPASETSEDDG